MASFFRRTGAQIARILQSAADPAAEASRVLIYGKDTAGVTNAYARSSDGTIVAITGPEARFSQPQILLSPKYGGATGSVALGTSNAKVAFIGYAYRAFTAGEVFQMVWRQVSAASGVTWAEVALATGPIVINGNPIVVPVGFVDISTQILLGPNVTATASIPLSGGQTIAGGTTLWAIMAKNSTGSPNLSSMPADDVQSGIVASNSTLLWRPSANIGVATAFTLDPSATQSPRNMLFAP